MDGIITTNCGGDNPCVIPDQIKDLNGRVLNHGKRIEIVEREVVEIKKGLFGEFNQKGLVGRVDSLEAVIADLKTAVDKVNKTLQAFTVSVVLTLIAGAINLIFFKK